MANTDLRVQRTKKVLKDNFKDLFLKYDYEKITIKELCEKSMVNRRTFYLHYNSIDDMLTEVLEEIAEEFYEYTNGYDHFSNPDRMIKDYFVFTSEHPLFEKINNNLEYNYIREMVNSKVKDRAIINFGSILHHDEFTIKMIATYLNSATVNMYRLWYNEGKTIPIDKAIEIASSLIKKGIMTMTKDNSNK